MWVMYSLGARSGGYNIRRDRFVVPRPKPYTPRLNPRTLIHPYTVRRGLDPTLEPRDYEGVPWGDEDEDMTSVRVGVEVIGR
jgi:hypothetical protein